MARPWHERAVTLHIGIAVIGVLTLAAPAAAGVAGFWRELAPEGPAPEPRMAMSVAYDAAHDRVIVFGGYGAGQFFNDTWALELSPTLRWVRLAPGAPASGRHETTAILDPVNDRMLVFGGKDLYQFYGDLLALPLGGPPAWSFVPQGDPAPGPRETRAIVDEARGRLVTTLGYTHPVHLGDAWEYDLAGEGGWKPLSPAGAGPTPRRGHSAVVDKAGDRVVVFGGYDDTQFFDESWSLDLAEPAWSPLDPVGDPPSPRYGHNAVLDPERRRVVLFGGYGPIADSAHYAPRGAFLDDAWVLHMNAGTSRWELVSSEGGPPAARDFFGMAWDPIRHRALVLCGNGPGGQLSDVWELTFAEPELPGLDVTPGTVRGVELVGAHARGDDIQVTFRLVDAAPARLDVFDAAGRRVGSAEVGALGSGEHTVRLARSDGAPSGICWVRLTRANETRVRKVFFVR